MIRFRILKDGRATVAGIHYQDFRSLMDAAAIHYYEMLDKKKGRGEKADREWAREQLQVLGCIKLAIDNGIAATYPVHPEAPLTKAERWKRVNTARTERQLLKRILDEMMAEAARRKKK